MKTTIKKLLVIIPVIVVSAYYLRIVFHESYSNATSKRIAGFILSVLLLFAWIIFITIRKKQKDLIQVIVQSSFFVYVFAVLQLTGYFILFKELSSQDWWSRMNHRIETNDHVNLKVFDTMNRYTLFSKQVTGNFIMLLPLGIFLPLLYRQFRRFKGFFATLFISLLVSVAIELLQLATSYRSTDIDDLILNTAGACTGFLIYQYLPAYKVDCKIFY